MLASIDDPMQEDVNIYIRLLDEGTEVFGPPELWTWAMASIGSKQPLAMILKTRIGSLSQAPIFEARFGPSSPGSI